LQAMVGEGIKKRKQQSVTKYLRNQEGIGNREEEEGVMCKCLFECRI